MSCNKPVSGYGTMMTYRCDEAEDHPGPCASTEMLQSVTMRKRWLQKEHPGLEAPTPSEDPPEQDLPSADESVTTALLMLDEVESLIVKLRDRLSC